MEKSYSGKKNNLEDLGPLFYLSSRVCETNDIKLIMSGNDKILVLFKNIYYNIVIS